MGRTDLVVEFAVTDASTGKPFPGAIIDIHSAGGFYEERDPQDFTLVTGPNGRAKRLCRKCMCFGTRGWNKDSYVVNLPWWFYRVSAPGYRATEKVDLDVPENVQKVQRGKPSAKLVVEVTLHRVGA